jgi:hypothetical protein
MELYERCRRGRRRDKNKSIEELRKNFEELKKS